MDKITAGLLGAVAGLATMGSAQAVASVPAAPANALHAAGYSDLLSPVPNALELLKASDAEPEAPARVQLAQYFYRGGDHHHHHHHHHQNYSRNEHHHHHARRYSDRGNDHHHHHHHHNQWGLVIR